MIVKMKFLSITGPKEDIDRVTEKYLSKYEIQLENALSELKTVSDLKPYMEINPYKDALTKAKSFSDLLDKSNISAMASKDITLEKALQTVSDTDNSLEAYNREKNNLESRQNLLKQSLSKIINFKELEFDVDKLLKFQFVKFRFGKISNEYYEKFEKYVYDDLDTVFYKCHTDEDYVWGVYFVPVSESEKIDAVYSSLHFERLFIPDEYEGKPSKAIAELEKKIAELDSELAEVNTKISELLSDKASDIRAAYDKLNSLSTNFDVRKLAACTKDDNLVFYILCGWMTESDAKKFEKEIENDPDIFCIVEDDHNNIFSTPPTKLKNPKLFKPFEMFIKMYGLPAYNEFDPTIFVALTYSFIFGAMFGDVGQGLVLFIGGLLLYKFKKINLAAIVSCAGVFSTFFGFMFGSVFGFENVLDAVWLRPVEHMTTLPFIGKLNTVFVVAIAFGMFLILVSMILHVINGFKQHDTENKFFDTNAMAGFVFYASLVLVIVLFMTGNTLPGGIVLAIMFGVPLILIALKEPLTRIVDKKAKDSETGVGMFIVQTLFEMFEVLLSYFSNTLSFVRIGAFAVSHAAMMEVVLMLAGATEGGNPNWIVVILGNLFVMGMEGLIVGIQVLRLEYYELFSRFYKGNGHEFKPYKAGNNK